MANLPDINTANVGIIAFWNAEDHKTAGVVDPTDCTAVFTSYSVYDNGLDGYITLGSGRNFNCRVKNDGWCVAWIDRTNTFPYPAADKVAADFGETGYKGYYDILWDWFAYPNISSTLTTLGYIISLFEAALETSGDFTFDAADVGHYCYEFTNANVLTLLSELDAGLNPHHAYFQYTSGTTLHYAVVTGSGNDHGFEVQFESNVIVNTPSTTLHYGVADIISENWIPNPLTDYDLYVRTWWPGVSAAYKAHGAILILWS